MTQSDQPAMRPSSPKWSPDQEDEHDNGVKGAWACSPIGGIMEAFASVTAYDDDQGVSGYVWRSTILDDFHESGACPTLHEAQIAAENALLTISEHMANSSQKRFQDLKKAIDR